MAALDDLIAELRAEAEVSVRTEYVNRITALEAELKYAHSTLVGMSKSAADWEKEAKVYQDKYIRLANAIETLNDTL